MKLILSILFLTILVTSCEFIFPTHFLDNEITKEQIDTAHFYIPSSKTFCREQGNLSAIVVLSDVDSVVSISDTLVYVYKNQLIFHYDLNDYVIEKIDSMLVSK